MGAFRVTGNCAPGFQYGGAYYKPGEVVEIPKEDTKSMAFSLDGDKKVFDKLSPLDAEAAAMSGWPTKDIALAFPPPAVEEKKATP